MLYGSSSFQKMWNYGSSEKFVVTGGGGGLGGWGVGLVVVVVLETRKEWIGRTRLLGPAMNCSV